MKILIKLIIFGLILTSCVNKQDGIEFKEVRNIYKSVSPKISEFQNLSKVEKELAIIELLKNESNQSFPLIEIDSLYSDYVFATFIFLDTAQNHQIEFEVFGIYDEHRFGDKKLYRLDSTDFYYRTYMIPNDLCLSYRFILTDTVNGTKQTVTDPLNNDLIPKGERKGYSWSVLDLRKHEIDWNTRRHGNLGSKLDTFKFTSNLLDNTRNIYVYLPSDYEKTTKKYPVIYLFDSFIYLNRVEVPNVLDNLIFENKIEPMIAVFIDNPTRISRDYELPMNPIFKDFVVKELIPKIKKQYRITDLPDQTIIGGMSYGGLAATYIGFDCDSIFGKVLSQSGSFWRDTIGDLKYANMNRTDYMINRFIKEDKRKIKIFLDWGLQEDMVYGANRKFVRILDQLDYDFKFIEFNGWHDWSNSRKTFSNGLLYLTDSE
jgi:enterochelin esterase family protein